MESFQIGITRELLLANCSCCRYVLSKHSNIDRLRHQKPLYQTIQRQRIGSCSPCILPQRNFPFTGLTASE